MTSYTEHFNDSVVKAVDEGFPLLMPRWGYVVSAFVLFLIGFFGFFLNLMVILLMFKDRQLWTPLNIILFNLVFSDFSVSVLGNPFTLISALFHRWIFGKTMCVLYGFFMALLGITSITTLTVISFERYMMVTRPLNAKHLSSKGAILSIVFIWTYSLALTTPPLMGWGHYVNEAANISCSVNWHEQSMNTLTYIMFLFAMGEIVPLAVITFSYVNIIRTLKRNSQRLGRVSRAETKATAMVFIMIVSFTVAWTPYSVFALLEQFATEGIVSPGAGVIPALVAKSSICYDPLIYVGMNTQFRNSIKRVFGVHSKGKNSHAEKAYNNTLTSPANKLSSVNTRLNCSETNLSSHHKNSKGKKIMFNDDISEMTTNEYHRTFTRDPDLCTIPESKNSDAERSGDTIYDEDSSNTGSNVKKLDLFGESCKVINERSPVLTFMDSDRLLFTKAPEEVNTDSNKTNVFGKETYEDHTTDKNIYKTENALQSSEKQKRIRQSYSLDFPRLSNDNKKRKLSIETKFESIQPKGFFKETINKLFDQDSKQGQDSFKSYLCEAKEEIGQDLL
ncbi:parapinopsin-like [Spodoptera litura]|uniref:Parapinopsin-like n=1 Tax=Spodoptera litura TaxID=69820 RepID=A0A9J7EUH6_SPOLT|nr:parapinopsin-like [Spodoptera litura]